MLCNVSAKYICCFGNTVSRFLLWLVCDLGNCSLLDRSVAQNVKIRHRQMSSEVLCCLAIVHNTESFLQHALPISNIFHTLTADYLPIHCKFVEVFFLCKSRVRTSHVTIHYEKMQTSVIYHKAFEIVKFSLFSVFHSSMFQQRLQQNSFNSEIFANSVNEVLISRSTEHSSINTAIAIVSQTRLLQFKTFPSLFFLLNNKVFQ